VAIDPKHLPADPKILQQMVLDLMAQLDREFSERHKMESLLRELLDAKRNRKSEQLSADQLALFAAAWHARQAAAQPSEPTDDGDDNDDPPSLARGDRTARNGAVAGRRCHATSNGSVSSTICRMRKSIARPAARICA
jgi:hypothetical protein